MQSSVPHCNGVYLAFGSNLGERALNLQRALILIQKLGYPILRQSPVYETEPQDVTAQPWFFNMVLEIETAKNPRDLLRDLQQIEQTMGRVRTAENIRGPRAIDIDILLFGDVQLHSIELTIPHPRMWNRRFVLQPLYDVMTASHNSELKDEIQKRLGQLNDQTIRAVETKQSS